MAGAVPRCGVFVVSVDVDGSNSHGSRHDAERDASLAAVLTCADRFKCPVTFGFRDLESRAVGTVFEFATSHEVAAVLPRGEQEHARLVRHLRRLRDLQAAGGGPITTLFTNASVVFDSAELLIKYGVQTVRNGLPVPTPRLVGPRVIRYGLAHLCTSTLLPGHVIRFERALGKVMDALEDAAIARSIFHLAISLADVTAETIKRQLTPVMQIAHTLNQAGHLHLNSIDQLSWLARRKRPVTSMQSILRRAA